ncbi:hypothetical protein Ancab_017338 [Ancistrocladus abbreviatus]
MIVMVPNVMDSLRQLVGSKGWDYCILWKLSQDQRFLEWLDCCCAGSGCSDDGGGELFFPASPGIPCRDVVFQHPRSKPCELLAQLPPSLPVDGFIAETLISNQPRWLNFSKISELSVGEETLGTKVLIPAIGGLIELFAAKQISEDQQVIDFVVAQCNIMMEQEALTGSSNLNSSFLADMNMINELQSKPSLSDQNNPRDLTNNCETPPYSPAIALENLNLTCDAAVSRSRLCNSAMNFMQQFSYMSENRSRSEFLEGSSDSFPSDQQFNPLKSHSENGYEDMDFRQNSLMINATNMHHNCQNLEVPGNEQQVKDKGLVKHDLGQADSASDSDQLDDEDDPKHQRRTGKGPQSKNLVAERKRRKKLNERLYHLRSLVPKISKLDRASILGDAIEYVKDLQKQAKDLQYELEQNSDDEGPDAKLTNTHQNILMEFSNQFGVKFGPAEHGSSQHPFFMGASAGRSHVDNVKRSQESEGSSDKAQQMEVQVEVAQLEGNEFFVKVFGEERRGGFVRLLEALNALGLEITNVNVTSCISLVSYVFIVEKRDSEIVQAEYLRDSLLEVTRNQSEGWSKITEASRDGNRMDHHQGPLPYILKPIHNLGEEGGKEATLEHVSKSL